VLILVVASLIPVFFAFAAATIPDEWLDRNVAERLPVRDHLFHGYINPVTRRRDSLFSNALVLPGFDLLEAEKIDDETKLAHAKSSFSLRGRHLENAVFDLADLRKADFEGALLKLASLKEAKLQGATLKSAQLQGATLYRADLRGATLDHANLQGATLDGAELQDASLKEAELQGADFDKATDLRSASTWRTNFSRPKLGFSANLKDLEDSPLSREAFASLRATLETEVPDGKEADDGAKPGEHPLPGDPGSRAGFGAGDSSNPPRSGNLPKGPGG
jgi:uncharacterized protein YjbI with pentapeptide repeats